MARIDPQVNIRMPAPLKAALDDAASANTRSLTAEIVARLEQSLIGPKHPPSIVVRLEALPHGTPPQEISLGTFFENFSWTVRASVDALKQAERSIRKERAADSLLPPQDEEGSAEALQRAQQMFQEQVRRRISRRSVSGGPEDGDGD